MTELSENDPAVDSPAAGTGVTISKLVLPLLLLAEFMIQIDGTIVNVALPSIKSDLGFSDGSLAWVVNGYVLSYGSLLLLGGRAADVLGRRRLLMFGLSVFTVASAVSAVAGDSGLLVAARIVQGAGAAAVAPAVLSLIITMFPEGKQRTSAMAAWGGAAAAGSVFGSLIGGALTSGPGWRWVFIINVPIGLAILVCAPRVMAVGRSRNRSKLDPVGTAAITLALFAMVYAVIGTETNGWQSTRTIALLVAAAVLLVLFVFVERSYDDPILPGSLLGKRNTSGSIATTVLFGATQLSCFFFVTLYLQQVLGYSAIATGFAYLPIMVGFGASSGIASSLIASRGVTASLTPGLILIAGGMYWLSTVPVGGNFWADILGPTLLTGLGLGMTYVPLSMAVTADVDVEHTGVASAMFTSSNMIGGALGLAVLSSIASGRTRAVQVGGGSLAHALVTGFHRAFFLGGCLALVALLVALAVIRVAKPKPAPAQPATPDLAG